MENNFKFNHLILIILALMSFHSNAQSLVEINNQWNIAVYPTFSPDTSSYSVRIGEDTLLNNISYNKIYYSNDLLNTNWVFDNTYVREDSTKKVFLKKGALDDVLLYDFSLQKNDTFLIEDVCNLIVNEVDSVMLNNGELRKRLKLGIKDEPNWGEEYWIEGIGSNFGVISHFGFCYFDYSDRFLCFYSDSELLYPENPPSCFITPVKEIKQNSIKIFPNPFQDFLYIENEELNIESYIVYDVAGKLIENGSLEGMNNQINLEQSKSGFYILLLRDKEGNLYSQKLIKE